MLVIQAEHVQEAFIQGMGIMKTLGVRRETRNGPALVIPGPVTTMYSSPQARILFCPERDANPFFHFAESLWMLAGRNDVGFCTRFVKRMADFSDDGVTFHGAYGHRWRNHFRREVDIVDSHDYQMMPIDQIRTIIEQLKANKDERRCVLGMWDPEADLGRNGKDVPCNTQAYFSVGAHGMLDMTVCNRSNDMIWGAYGANAVHFSMLQEFVAAGVGVPVGHYWQMSNNFHAYLDTFEPLAEKRRKAEWCPCPYDTGQVRPRPLVTTRYETWLDDLNMFLDVGMTLGIKDSFFRKVAAPIFEAHDAYKEIEGPAKFDEAAKILDRCCASDWRLACYQWIGRRKESWYAKKA